MPSERSAVGPFNRVTRSNIPLGASVTPSAPAMRAMTSGTAGA
jgi:hypothetical protein